VLLTEAKCRDGTLACHADGGLRVDLEPGSGLFWVEQWFDRHACYRLLLIHFVQSFTRALSPNKHEAFMCKLQAASGRDAAHARIAGGHREI
jgi:hypothetical protein